MNRTQNIAAIAKLIAASKTYGTNGRATIAVQDISLEVSAGKLILLLGPSGSGKTTLLTLMAGLIKPSSGNVLLFGNDIVSYPEEELQRLRARRIGFVFQHFLLVESLTVLENVALVLQFGGKSSYEGRRQARDLLRRIGIEHLAEKFPNKLSQGEKQRVAIARAIANGGELIIADEPTASLETKKAMEIIRLLQSLAKDQIKCVVVASHDLRLVPFADQVLHLRDGKIEKIEQQSPNAIDSLQEAKTVQGEES